MSLNLENKLVDILTFTDDLKLQILQMVIHMTNNNLFISKISNLENLVEIIDGIYIYSAYHKNNLNYKDMVKYINRNPILKTKKIILNPRFDLEYEKLEEIKQYFNDFSNIYVKLNGNELAVKIEDAINTVNIIDEIINKIKNYNFSPLEQIMYTYYIVRDRFYVEEDENEPCETSRDLTAVLLGDKIVCLGFSKIFDCIMKKL